MTSARQQSISTRAGADETGRKQVQRLLEDLDARGLAVTLQPMAAKTLGARLTDGDDAQARGMAGLPGLAAALAVLGEIWPRK